MTPHKKHIHGRKHAESRMIIDMRVKWDWGYILSLHEDLKYLVLPDEV